MLGNTDDQVEYHKVVKKVLNQQFEIDLEHFAMLAYANVADIGCAYRICPDNDNYIHCVNSAG
ncbi:unnamed protein product [Cylicostephanus goldi]|uniref:SCP domain-containing protein n=1 Tax=Cylicostephanus goldi TaxID=71465 RepID=A0A3P6SVF8_CYLGO|nr:unnamed protein product [Cylicostephanus goldi]